MTAPAATSADTIDWARVRADFPLLARQVHGKPLVYLDSANTGQKPAAVIEAVDDFYRRHNANVSRAVHQLGSEATEAYEATRTKLAAHLNVHRNELVLTSGTTFAINLVAYSWALPRLGPGDAILLTQMEHHANIVPWQLVAERTGAVVKVAPMEQDGSLDPDRVRNAMTPDVKLFGLAHVSNVLGTVNPVRDLCREARGRGIATLVDGSQALPHLPVDIAAIGCDFYAFTGHKMCGPTGTGALWARRSTTSARSAWRTSPRAKPTCWRTCPMPWPASTACASSAPPRARPRSCPSCWRGRTRTTWRPCWTWKASRSAPGTTARTR